MLLFFAFLLCFYVCFCCCYTKLFKQKKVAKKIRIFAYLRLIMALNLVRGVEIDKLKFFVEELGF